jgi:UDP-N-acetylmuramoyl-L-alanyl-D-glutamate--2,6-diaminopimelate ligase
VPDSRIIGVKAEETRVVCLVIDSRATTGGALFCALPGTKADGWLFAKDAQDRGAVAVLTPHPLDGLTIPQLVAPNVRRALAQIARAWYGSPDEKMALVGVTGTNGKTTTIRLIAAMAGIGGYCPATIGTLGATLDGEDFAFDTDWNTTPEAHELRRLLNALWDKGATLTAMEVSSHGLALDRVWGLRFRAGVFTNLTEDHLDFHQTFEEYFRAKAQLFEELAPESIAVINRDDPYGERLLGMTKARVISYGFTQEADVHPVDLAELPHITGTIATPIGRLSIDMTLAGRFNIANAMSVVAVGIGLGMSGERIAEGLRSAEPAPGRFEPVHVGQDFTVVVDYAHTPDALKNVLQAARKMVQNQGRVLCVVGCGGDRDPFKRPVMGRIATTLADVTVFTSDNPRTEDPEKILDSIIGGVSDEYPYERIEPRRDAIGRAIELAQPGDIVVIAGKGHEPYQEVGHTRFPFDDRTEARSALHSRLYR